MNNPTQKPKQWKPYGWASIFLLVIVILGGSALSFPQDASAAGRPVTSTPVPTSSIPEPTSENLVYNGDFSDGLQRWSYYMDNTAMAYRSVTNGEYVYQITDAGNYLYSIQFQKWGLPIVNGRTYAVYFSARALEGSRTIVANVGHRENPWTDYSGGAKTFNLTSTMQRFSYTFTMSQPTDWDAQMVFQLGLNLSDVVFDNIALYDLTGGAIPQPPAMPSPSRTYDTLVWSDEFEGTSVDQSNWTFEIGRGMNGWGNQELQYYTSRSENVSVANGMLTITARKENYRGAQYTSARLKTQGKRFFTYGLIEARVLLPKGQGIWPAFWTLGENINTVSWPDCGEIDILEMIGGGEMRDDTMFGNLHWSQADGSHTNYGESVTVDPGDLGDAWHSVSIVWDEQYIYYFLDGTQYHYIAITDPAKSEFHAPHFILLNLAVGGVWPGYPDANTVFPQQYKIDYVRVYQ